jgi:hypothetical protein
VGHVLRRDVERQERRDDLPGDEDLDELADADEAVGQETEHADDREQHDDQVRQAAAAVVAEAGLDPLGAGEHAGGSRRQVAARNTWLNTGYSQESTL